MILEVFVLVAVVGIIVTYLKNKKFILSLPYLLMIFITPIYAILDKTIFVKVFGCGCVPSAQTNMLNIAFNANDLRAVVYTVFILLMGLFGIVLSKELETKKEKTIYIATILLCNSFIAFEVCKLMMWG